MWYISKHFLKEKEFGTLFYLFPTVEYQRDYLNDDIGDYEFNINFKWLFWSFSFTRNWHDEKINNVLKFTKRK